MYIQITDKCNMKCEHCGFSCTRKGSFMSVETFKAALQIAQDYDSTITIGGGEPTLHPHFEKFLLLAIAAAGKMGSDYKVFIVTNGSIKDRAMMIGQLSAASIIDGYLSYDQFHNLDIVDEEVIEWFRSMDHLWGPVYDPRGQKYADPVRATRKLSKRGRAVKFVEAEDTCVCADIIVKPNGDMYACGCPDAPKIGSTSEGFTADPYFNQCCHEDRDE